MVINILEKSSIRRCTAMNIDSIADTMTPIRALSLCTLGRPYICGAEEYWEIKIILIQVTFIGRTFQGTGHGSLVLHCHCSSTAFEELLVHILTVIP